MVNEALTKDEQVTCPCCDGEPIENENDECPLCCGTGKVTAAEADDWRPLRPEECL